MSYPATCLLGHRLNAFRLNYTSGAMWINIGGAWADGTAQGILVQSLTIHDRLNDTPNTLIATVRGMAPGAGQAIRVAIGSHNAAALFAGTILRVTRVWAANNPAHVLHHLEAIDPTWQLEADLVSARYQNQSATAIAADLLTRAPAGFTGAFEAGLPVLDEISFTNSTIMGAFGQLANRIGGYTRVDYVARIYLFRTLPAAPPLALTADHPSLADVSLVQDLTQIVTRAIVEGGGGNALTDVPAGSTILPVDVGSWYVPGGGFVRSGPQRIAYAAATPGGAGAYVGSGVTPTTAPTIAAAPGASAVEIGTHHYAYTWLTAAGETLPSPLVAAVVGPGSAPIPDPVPQPFQMSNISYTDTMLTIGVTYAYAWAWNYGNGSSTGQGAVGPLSAARQTTIVSWLNSGVEPPTQTAAVVSCNIYTGPIPAGATGLLWYRQLPGGGWYCLAYIPRAYVGNSTYQPIDHYGDPYVLADPARFPAHPNPTAGNVALNQLTVTGIAPGPTNVTARRVYRTAANAAQLKALALLADNTSTALPAYDNVADAALGANAPTVDTAGLVQTTKLVPAGSTDLPVTSVAPFAVGGGYAGIGAQVIRYGGLLAAALTGIPATGPGALAQSVAWGTPIAAPAALTGIPASGAGAIAIPIRRGDPVSIVVIVDDAPAQAALAARVGGTGVRESPLVDGRIGVTEAAARGRALLAQHKDLLETVAHRSRDTRTRSGALVAVELPAPTDIHGTYRIQDVNIGPFNGRGLAPPVYQATSASQLFTFEDLIRQLANTTPPPATGE